MREVKFRVHDKDTGKVLAYEFFNASINWGYFWLDASEPEGDRVCHAPPEYFKHPRPLGTLNRVLFTGLHDKNGKEIYEGDIVNLGVKAKGDRRGAVIFSEKAAKFAVRIYRDGYRKNEPHLISIIKSEVIGNIYENPDLIK
jgi:hypothetical protein